jgi:small subunit ribosomal protein S3
MGQKTNPVGLRIAVTRDWRSKWYAGKKDFGKLLSEDRQVRTLLKKRLESASVPQILIERAANRCRITILTARPGIVIGRKGAEIDKLKEELSKMTGKEIYVDIVEVKTPEIEAQLVAENVALQLERRVSFRRAMKKALQTAKDFGAEGIKTRCAPTLTMVSPKPTLFTESWGSSAGFARAKPAGLTRVCPKGKRAPLLRLFRNRLLRCPLFRKLPRLKRRPNPSLANRP